MDETEARSWLQINLEEPNGCAHTDAAIRWALGRIAELERQLNDHHGVAVERAAPGLWQTYCPGCSWAAGERADICREPLVAATWPASLTLREEPAPPAAQEEPAPEEVQAATELLHQALEAWGALMVINDRGLNRVDGDAHEIAAALIHAGWSPPARKES